MWSVITQTSTIPPLGNALKKMAFALLYLEPPLQDQSNVPPSGEKGLCCQVTVSMQTGYVSRIHRTVTSCWGGKDKHLFTRFISSLFVRREVHKRRDETATSTFWPLLYAASNKPVTSPSLASSGSRASWRFPKTKASVDSMPASSTPNMASIYAQCTEQFPGEKLLTRSPQSARISAHAQESGNNTHARARQKPASRNREAISSTVLFNTHCSHFTSKRAHFRRDSKTISVYYSSTKRSWLKDACKEVSQSKLRSFTSSTMS